MATHTHPNTITNGTAIDADPIEENFDSIDTFLNTDVVQRDGSVSMTGLLTLSGDPSGASHAVRKSYADGLITTHEAASNPHPTYLTAAEGNAAYTPILKGVVSNQANSVKVVYGTTIITFSASGTSNTVAVDLSGEISNLLMAVAVGRTGVALAVIPTSATQFTVQGAHWTSLSGAVTVSYIAVGT